MQGIPDKFDARKLLKAMKKEFACNGHVVHSADSDESGDDSPAPGKKDDHGKVLQFQGDQRESSKEFLIASNIVKRKDAKTRIVVWVLSWGVLTTATATRRVWLVAAGALLLSHGFVSCSLACNGCGLSCTVLRVWGGAGVRCIRGG